jgi:hypothetical protein
MSVKLPKLALVDCARRTQSRLSGPMPTRSPQGQTADIDYLRFFADVSSESPQPCWQVHELEGLSTSPMPEQPRQDLPERNRRI